VLIHRINQSSRKKEDTHQRGARPSGKKSINCSKPGSLEKPDDSWRMCIDYTSLNKACPKDEYPQPYICQIIDSTMSCELLLFLDAYPGYH
jgi:hypothetical protein